MRWLPATVGVLLLGVAASLGIVGLRHGAADARGARASAGTPPPSGVRLRVVSFNVWGLPFDRAPALDERLARMPAALRALDADVLCFQEVWTPRVAQALVTGFAPEYAAARVSGGGLLLLARLPISDASFVAHPEPPGLSFIERLAHKGVLAATVATKAGPVRVLDLHCVAFDHASRDVQLRALVEKVLPGQPDLPIVLAGDFNLEGIEGGRRLAPPYASILGLGFVDSRPVEHGEDGADELPSPVTMGGWPREESDRAARTAGWSPDHVFVRGGGGRSVRVTRSSVELWTRATALSDHNLVLAELEVGPGT